MSKVLNKGIAFLLAAMMVLALMAMPVMPAMEAEAADPATAPTASKVVREITFEGDTLKGGAATINPDWKSQHWQTGSTWGQLIEGNTYVGHYTDGGAAYGDGYFQMETANGNTVLKHVSDSRAWREANGKTRYMTLVVRPSDTTPLTGKVAVDYDIKVTQMDVNGVESPMPTPTTTGVVNPADRAFSTNGYSTAPSLWFNGSRIQHANQWNSSLCSTCGTLSTASMWQDATTDFCKVRTIIDTTNGKYTMAKWNGTEYETITHEVNGDTHPVTGDHTQAEVNMIWIHLNTQYAADATPTADRTVYRIDNIRFTQLGVVPQTATANIENNAKEVDVERKDFAVDFGMNITAAEMAEVKILKNGVEVPANKVLNDDTTVVVSPINDLERGTQYTLSIPAIVRAEGTQAAQSIVFNTVRGFDEYLVGKATFDTDVETRDGVYTLLQSTFPVTAEIGFKNSQIYVKDGKLQAQHLSTDTTTSNYWFVNLKETISGICRFEFTLDLPADLNKPTNPYAYMIPLNVFTHNGTKATEIARFRIYNGAIRFYPMNDGDNWANAKYMFMKDGAFQGEHKYILDINTNTGDMKCTAMNPATHAIEDEIEVSYNTPLDPVWRIKFSTQGAPAATYYAKTKILDEETGLSEATLSVDDFAIYAIPVAAAKLETPTVNVANGDDIVIGFNRCVEDVTGLELYDGETKVDDAVFELNPDGYSCNLVANLDPEKTYEIKVNVTATTGEAIAASLGFHTAPKLPQITLGAKVYLQSDTEFATPLDAIAAGDKVVAVVEFTNNEALVAYDAIVYVAFYDEDGKLLLATATEENVAANTTETFSAKATVPAGTDSVRVFAWDKALTPYCDALDVIK